MNQLSTKNLTQHLQIQIKKLNKDKSYNFF